MVCPARWILTPVLFLLLLCPISSVSMAAEPLRFAYQNRIGDALSIVAVNKNLFSAEGLTVKPLLFNNGPACSEALYTGAVDIATMGDTAALVAVSQNTDLRIIASHGAGEKRHRIIVAGNSPLKNLTDLKGKRIAVKKGTSTYGGFLALLAARGINPAELKLTELDPAIMPEALAAGSVDAFVASEPTPSLAEQKGGRELADLGGLGNNYPLLILVKTGVISKHDSDLKRFFRALAKAEQFIRRHPRETAAILSKETGLTPELTGRAMQRHSYRLQLDAVTVASLGKTAEFLLKQSKIKQLPDLSVAVTTQYLQLPAVKTRGRNLP